MNKETEPITRKETYRFFGALFIAGLFFCPFNIPFRQWFANNLFLNILGGIIVAVLSWLYIEFKNYLSAFRFKNIYGRDVKKQFFLVYGLMNLRETFDKDGKLMKMPYFKPEVPGMIFGNIIPASASQLRGAKYISESFGRNIRTSPTLATDVEIQNRMDISFCSIGGTNNLKTNDILGHNDNVFFKFADPSTIMVIKGNDIKFTVDGVYDYGFIMKIKPESLGNRVWIGIAGLGEWGTSGAAWYLARNWKEIERKYGSNPFGLVVKVMGGKDESAELVYQSSL